MSIFKKFYPILNNTPKDRVSTWLWIVIWVLPIVFIGFGTYWGSSGPLSLWEDQTIAKIRFLRVLAAFHGGGLLVFISLILQIWFASYWAEPYILGVSGWSHFLLVFFQTLFLFLTDGQFHDIWDILKILAVTGGAFCSLLPLWWAVSIYAASQERLILVGLVSNALSHVAYQILSQLTDRWQIFMADISWGGHVPYITAHVLAGSLLVSVGPLIFLHLRFSDIVLHVLSYRTRHYLNIFHVLVAMAILNGVSILLIGSVGFIGIVVPFLLHKISWRSVTQKSWGVYSIGGSLYAFFYILGQNMSPPQEWSPNLLLTLAIGPWFLIYLFKHSKI